MFKKRSRPVSVRDKAVEKKPGDVPAGAGQEDGEEEEVA
jgi:hypothetical protein